MRWVEALKIWNAEKGGAWCVPRKGSAEHATVMKIIHGEQKMKAAAPAPAAPAKTMKKKIVATGEPVDLDKLGVSMERKKKERVAKFLLALHKKRKEKKKYSVAATKVFQMEDLQKKIMSMASDMESAKERKKEIQQYNVALDLFLDVVKDSEDSYPYGTARAMSILESYERRMRTIMKEKYFYIGTAILKAFEAMFVMYDKHLMYDTADDDMIVALKGIQETLVNLEKGKPHHATFYEEEDVRPPYFPHISLEEAERLLSKMFKTIVLYFDTDLSPLDREEGDEDEEEDEYDDEPYNYLLTVLAMPKKNKK